MHSNEQVMTSASIRRLSPDQCQRLYWACLEILERTGIRLFHQEALDLMARAGVKATDGNRVRIPSSLVEKALTTAPQRVTLCDRHGNRVMPVEGYRSFFGPGSDCLNIIDHRDNRRREPVLQDVVDAVTVADALERVNFVMCMFLPTDVPQDVADRYQMEVMLTHTTKPIVYVTTDFSGCADVVEMAEIVAGGAEELRRNPNVACYVNVATGLRHNKEALQKLLFLSEKGLPFTYCPSTQGGATAPVTVAGAIAVAQAGALAGLVLAQLTREGSPFVMPGWGGNMLDMRTTIQPYADPDKRLAVPDFVHWLGLPMFALGGCSDSKVVDEQAGIEAAMTLMTEALGGGNIVHDLGYLESGLTGSLAQLVICDEILGWLEHFVPGVVIDDETLALDLIDEMGPDGQYLSCDHTLKHYRERWYPSLFDRNNFDGWQVKGGKTLRERAAERVSHILSHHQVEKLATGAARGVRQVVERAAAGPTPGEV